MVIINLKLVNMVIPFIKMDNSFHLMDNLMELIIIDIIVVIIIGIIVGIIIISLVSLPLLDNFQLLC
jgi:hypothetical protein